LREIATRIRERNVSEVLEARVLEPGEADRLRECPEGGRERWSLPMRSRWTAGTAASLLGIEEPETLSADDVGFVQTHRNSMKS
jgi:hypothetical protein